MFAFLMTWLFVQNSAPAPPESDLEGNNWKSVYGSAPPLREERPQISLFPLQLKGEPSQKAAFEGASPWLCTSFTCFKRLWLALRVAAESGRRWWEAGIGISGTPASPN